MWLKNLMQKHHVSERDYVWNPNICTCEVNKHLKGIDDDLVITYDEIINAVAKSYNDPTKTTSINFNEKIPLAKWEISIFCLLFN